MSRLLDLTQTRLELGLSRDALPDALCGEILYRAVVTLGNPAALPSVLKWLEIN
jgi:hypothetical protein